MSEDTINFSEIFALIRRNLLLIFLLIALSVSTSVLVGKLLPRKYKSKAVLSIQSSYFQNAMVSDLMPQVWDAGEQSAQRSSLLRLALSDSFLDRLGKKYGFYENYTDPNARILEREGLFRRIEYFSLNPTTFQISAIASSPPLAYEMTKDIVKQMIDTLIYERQKNLVNTRNALQQQVSSLSLALEGISSAASFQYENLAGELEKIEASIKALTSQYTERHPEVLKLKEKAESIRNALKNASPSDSTSNDTPDRSASLIKPGSKNSIQEVYNELVKKLNYLNIVVEMDSDPSNVPYLAIIEQPSIPVTAFAPNMRAIMTIGLVAGLFLAAVSTLFRELRRGTFLAPARAADELEVPFLGELPRLVRKDKVQLLDGPGVGAVRQSLPSPVNE